MIFLTLTKLLSLFKRLNLSSLPNSNPGGGNPWLHSSGSIVVGAFSGSTVVVREVDGSPSGAVNQIVFPNSTVSIVDGVATITGLQGPQGPAGPVGATGATGATGPAGPNSVSTSTTTTLNGFLTGNGSNVGTATTTGSGSTLVLSASPTLVTPNIGAATGTSVVLSGGTSSFTSASAATTALIAKAGGASASVPIAQVQDSAGNGLISFWQNSSTGQIACVGGFIGFSGSAASRPTLGMMQWDANTLQIDALAGTCARFRPAADATGGGLQSWSGLHFSQSGGASGTLYGTWWCTSAGVMQARRYGTSTAADLDVGNVTAATGTFVASAAGNRAVIARGAASSTVPIFEVRDSDDNAYFAVQRLTTNCTVGIVGPSGGTCALGFASSFGGRPLAGFAPQDANGFFAVVNAGYVGRFRMQTDALTGGISSYAGVHVGASGGSGTTPNGSIWCNSSNVFEFFNYGTTTPANLIAGWIDASHRPYTVAGLPLASGSTGKTLRVTDSTLTMTSANYGSTPSGGGSNNSRVFSNGSSWIIA